MSASLFSIFPSILKDFVVSVATWNPHIPRLFVAVCAFCGLAAIRRLLAASSSDFKLC